MLVNIPVTIYGMILAILFLIVGFKRHREIKDVGDLYMYNESKHDSEGLIMIKHHFLYVT